MKPASNSILDNMGSVSLHKPRYRFCGKEEAESYYQYSPYSYCANNPTNLIDPDGERIFATFYDGKSWVDYEFMFSDKGWQFINTDNGLVYGDDSNESIFMDDLIWTLRNVMSHYQGYNYIKELVSIKDAVVIQFSNNLSSLNSYFPYKGTEKTYSRALSDIHNNSIVPIGAINWCNPAEITPDKKRKLRVMTENGPEINTLAGLVHELAHFYDHSEGRDINEEWQQGANIKNYITTSEIYALHVENIIRVEQGDALRTRYLSGTILKYGNKDAVIDKKTKTSLFFLTGDIFCRDYKFIKGGEVYGYSYR